MRARASAVNSLPSLEWGEVFFKFNELGLGGDGRVIILSLARYAKCQLRAARRHPARRRTPDADPDPATRAADDTGDRRRRLAGR